MTFPADSTFMLTPNEPKKSRKRLKTKKNHEREKEAADAYLKFLQGKGAASGSLYKKSHFLDVLIKKLAGRKLTRGTFSRALDVTMKTVNADDRYESLNTAREYYPFWMEDIKAIATFSEHYGFDVDSIMWEPLPIPLKSLTAGLASEVFDAKESFALNVYIQALHSQSADQSIVDTRAKLAKVILIRLRDAPVQSSKTYRMAVDIILPLFTEDKIKQLFLAVVREFYYFWTDDPDAAEKVFGRV